MTNQPGALIVMAGHRIAANVPTPLVGVRERIDISVFLLWVVVLAIALSRTGATVTGWTRKKK